MITPLGQTYDRRGHPSRLILRSFHSTHGTMGQSHKRVSHKTCLVTPTSISTTQLQFHLDSHSTLLHSNSSHPHQPNFPTASPLNISLVFPAVSSSRSVFASIPPLAARVSPHPDPAVIRLEPRSPPPVAPRKTPVPPTSRPLWSSPRTTTRSRSPAICHQPHLVTNCLVRARNRSQSPP